MFDNSSKAMFDDEIIKVIALAEFIKYFSKERLSLVIFDGELSSKSKENLERIIHPLTPAIQVVPKADQYYPLVHKADAIANKLFKYYSTGPIKSRLKYEDRLITPTMEEYKKYSKKLK